jgi:hypothetical protein
MWCNILRRRREVHQLVCVWMPQGHRVGREGDAMVPSVLKVAYGDYEEVSIVRAENVELYPWVGG